MEVWNKLDLKKNNSTSSIRQVVSNKCKVFGQHCTIHGIYYFFSSSHWWVSLSWCCIMASSLTLCGFLGHMIWGKFVGDPTFTVVESTRYPIEKIPFPAVIICDTEMIYRPSTENITKILHLRGYNLSQINEVYRSFTMIKNKDYKPETYVKKMHVILEDLGFSYESLLKKLRKPCDVVLQQCAWRSRVADCNDMFRQVLTIAGYCCQFDLRYFRPHAKNNTIFFSGMETTEGLDITVNSRRYDNVTNNDGYLLLYVFDEHDDLTLLDSSITITPATYFDIKLEVWAIDSSNDVKALSVKNRRCTLKDDGLNSISYQDCMTKLIMKKVVEICNCLPFRFSSEDLRVKLYPACAWYQMACVYETLEDVHGKIRNLTPQDECYQNCDYVQYSTEAEYLKQERDLGDSSKGFSRITVHFSDDTCMKYRREVLYTWDQMLANLGGIFGLCLGGSIISIIEILWFVLDLFYTIAAVFHKKVGRRTKLRKYNMKMAKNKNFGSKISPGNTVATVRLPYVN